MLKIKLILSICVIVVCGLIVAALLLPKQAREIEQKVLGETISLHPSIIVSSAQAMPLSVEDIIDATNQERINAGLAPLKTNDKLAISAKSKTDDMVLNQYFEHTSPSGKTVADLAKAAGYNYVVLGENLAVGDFVNAHDLLTAWMNSPGHRANILNPSYDDIGVYAEQGTYEGHAVWFAVQHFGTERGVCPAINVALKATIDNANAGLEQQKAAITALRTQIEDPNHVQGQPYTDMITQFNAMVAAYNAGLSTTQTKITAYNKGVVAFNKCLSTYQVPIPEEK